MTQTIKTRDYVLVTKAPEEWDATPTDYVTSVVGHVGLVLYPEQLDDELFYMLQFMNGDTLYVEATALKHISTPAHDIGGKP